MFRQIMAAQVGLSRRVERRLPAYCRRDGHLHFTEQVVPRFLRPGVRLYDVGGGKRPYLTSDAKQAIGAHVVGLDIDPAELAQAPDGAYDHTITADLATFRGGATLSL